MTAVLESNRTALRERMIEDMTVRGFNEKTRNASTFATSHDVEERQVGGDLYALGALGHAKQKRAVACHSGVSWPPRGLYSPARRRRVRVRLRQHLHGSWCR